MEDKLALPKWIKMLITVQWKKKQNFPVIALQFKTKRWLSFTCLALYGVGTSTKSEESGSKSVGVKLTHNVVHYQN